MSVMGGNGNDPPIANAGLEITTTETADTNIVVFAPGSRPSSYF